MKLKLSFLQKIITLSVLVITSATYAYERGEREHSHPKKPKFSEIDLDQSGYVTLEEFKLKPIPFGTHEQVFHHIDVNQDGEITEKEFTEHKPPKPPHHGGGKRTGKPESR